MENIDSFFQVIKDALASPKFEKCAYPVYRGHSKNSYVLLPTLHRVFNRTGDDIWTLENNLYSDFRSLAGPRITFKSSWDALFTMRHEGIPTRLLDWTENIGTALFFALNTNEVDKPHIWILNPFDLNNKDLQADGTLLNPEEDMDEYYKTYANICNDINIREELHELPLVIYPNRSNERLLAQRGLFTIHGKDERKMEDSCKEFIEKIEIPENIIEDLRTLIKYFGINSYSVYPDLKGLSEYLKEIYNY